MAYLIGDILSVSKTDVLLIWLGLVIVLLLLFWRWSALLLCTLNEDLAACKWAKSQERKLCAHYSTSSSGSRGHKGCWRLADYLFINNTCCIFAFTWIDTRENGRFCLIDRRVSAILGFNASYVFDTPTGPSIVCVASIIFIITSDLFFFTEQFSTQVLKKKLR